MTAQLSAERKGRITGSRVGAILGLSKYRTRDDVMRELVREHHGAPSEFTGNVATEHGNEHEEDARAAFEAVKGLLVLDAQEFFIHPEHDFLGVSVDGLVGADEIAEFKCPYRAAYTSITPEYAAQVQLQLACTGRSAAWFVIWRSYDQADRLGVDPLIIEHVPADPDWLPSHLVKLAEFHAEFMAICANPKLAEPYLVDPERADAEWAAAADDYRHAQQVADAAAQQLDDAKARLRELAGDRPARGCGVQVLRSERAGAVDWRKVAEKYASDADVEPFRKPGSVVWTVKAASQ